MPNKKKLYEALRDEGYDNFADEKSFKDYVDNPINRRKLFNALKNEGYDNFEDINDFNKYLGYDKPYTHEYDESGKLVGGTAYKDSEPSRYEYKPEVQQYILDHKPDMFKPKTVDMYGAHDKDKAEWDLMNEGKLYEMQDARQRYLQRPITSFGESFEQGADALYQGGKNLVGEVSNLATGSQRDYERARLQLDELIQSGYDLTNFDSKKALKDYKDREYQRKYDEWQKDIATREEEREGMGFFDALLHRIKDPSRPKSQYEETGNLADEVQLARSYTAIQEALQKTNGNVDEAYKLLGKESSKETWGDKISREARAELAKQRPTEGFAAWAGGMLPQMIGTGAGIVASLNPYTRWLSPLLGRANMALLTGATSGMSMAEARDYGASEGDIWKTGIIDAAIEYGTEKLPFERYFGKIQNATKSVIGKSIAKATVDNDAVQNELSELLQRVGKEFGAGLFSKKNISEYLKDVGTEGVSEFMAEALQTISPMVYQNPEDYPTLMEILESGWEGAKGGLFMGAFLGAGSKYSANRIHNQRRKSQGNVTFADTNIGVVEILDEKDGVTSVLDVNGEVHEISSDEIKEKATISYNDFVNGSYQKEASDIEDAYNDGVLLETPYDKHNAKRAVDRAEAALGVGSENSDEQQFAQMVMAGANSPVETINAMAEQGYSDEQIQKAKDYYTAYHRMNGLTDALLDEVDSKIESANVEVDMNTNKELNQVIKVVLRDGRQGYVVNGTVTANEEGVVDVNHSDSEIMVRFENGDTEMMNPNKDLQSVAWIDSPAKLKENNNTVLRQSLIDNGIQEIDWNPATPNPKVGDLFEMDGIAVTIVGHDGHGGMFVLPSEEWQAAQGSEQKQQAAIAKAQQMGVVQAGMFKQWASDQLDAQEEAQAVAEEGVVKENFTTETQQPIAEKRPMTENEANELISRMGANAEPMPNIEFTPENWQAAFGENGTIETPIGTVKMGENQISKLFLKKRTKEFGMIAPTLSNPDIIIEEASSSKEGKSERESSYLFIKTFIKDGQKVRYYTSVTVLQDGMEVSVSSHVLGDKQVPKKMMEGNVIYIKEALSSNSSDGHLAEQPNAVPDLLPTQENNAPLSINKDSEKNVQSQENKDKPLHEREKEDVFRELGEKYGEKMPKKVEVTAKALANDLKKAENAISKAQNDLDNAPIGRDDKQQAKLDKAKQVYEAVKREADFWAEMDADIKAAQAQREAILNPVAEVDSSAEPQSVDEFVAQQLDSGNIVLNKEDFKRETGFGTEEVTALNGGAQKLLTDKGMTIQEAGERLMEMDRENGTNFFDQSDPNAGRDALIDLLGSVKTRKELNSYIKDKRENQAVRETEALRIEVEDFIRENFHMTPEDYATLLEVEMQNNPYEGVDLKAIDAIFAEKEFESETLNDQDYESEGNVDGNSGESELLLEEQAGEPSGDNASPTNEQAEGIGSGTQTESETSQASQPSEVRIPQIADVFAAAEKIDAEEKRRRPLRNRANEWAKALGVKVHFIERVEDVKSANVLAALKNGNKVAGWYSQVTGEVFFLMPNLDNVDEIDNTYVHEVVAHKGMFDMLGKERYDELCDKVWEMMPKSEQKRFINYPGVNGNTRIAADEYIAHLSESLNLTPKQQGIWDKIVQFFRELFDQKLNGILSKSNITNDDISNLIKASYANLKANSVSEVEGSGAVEEAQEVLDSIKQARKEVDTNPTEAQKEAGNYKKGHIKIDGFDITIENPKGGVRSGTDKNGKKWSITMNNDYGYIRGTEAVDGDHIDVFLSSFPTQGSVFVVDQSNEDGSFDESKVMYGFSSLEEARAAYLSNYEKGWESRIMAITEVSKEEFKKWVDSSHRKIKAFSEYKNIKTAPSIEETNVSRMADIEARILEIEGRRNEISDELAETPDYDALKVAELRAEEWELDQEQSELEAEYSGLRSMNDESNAILENEGSDLRFSTKKKRALETVSTSRKKHQQTVISSADGAKILNNLDNLAEKYENDTHTKEKTFIGEVAKAIEARKQGSGSQYATFETVNGNVVTIRLADHNAKVSNFDNRDENEGISIVVSAKDNNGITNDGDAHIVEYFYDSIDLRRADGKPLAEIVKSLKQALYSGEFKDTTGLAERQEVNESRFRVVYHGSGAEFDKFDHSFMGTGEGNQAFGWGTYVTDAKDIGKQYAKVIGGEPVFTYKGMSSDEVYKKYPELQYLAFFMDRGDTAEKAIEHRRSILNKVINTEGVDWFRKDMAEKSLEVLDSLEPSEMKMTKNRHLYEVEIPDNDGTNYLSWEVPLTDEQKERVKNELVKTEEYKSYAGRYGKEISEERVDAWLSAKGGAGRVYRFLENFFEDSVNSAKAVSVLLSNAGFVGMEYPANYYGGGNSHGDNNHVIFNEDDLKIVEHTRFRFIGERGASNLDKAEEVTTRLDNLAVAREMEAAEKDAKTIKMATGWERGADGLWRYEVDDVKVKDISETQRHLGNGEKLELKDVLTEDSYRNLITEYPKASKLKFYAEDFEDYGGGYYDGNNIVIKKNYIWYNDFLVETIIHELQHAIQSYEGFESGTSPEEMKDWYYEQNYNIKAASRIAIKRAYQIRKKADKLIKNGKYRYNAWAVRSAIGNWASKPGYEWGGPVETLARLYSVEELKTEYDSISEHNRLMGGLSLNDEEAELFYKRNSGEVEARNAARRMNMPSELRRKILASETEDVSREDQNFLNEAMEGQTMFRVVKDPAVDYISQAEDIVEVPRDMEFFTMNNVANKLYQNSGRFMRDLYKYGTLGRVLKGEYAEIDQIKAKKEYDHAKPILDEYLNQLVWMKHHATEAAQEVINDVISDVEYAMQYYKDLSLGKDVWRTNVSPRFRISEEKREAINKNVTDFASKYKSKQVVVAEISSMTDEEIENMFDNDASEVRKAIEKGLIGGYDQKSGKIYIFAENQNLDDLEDTLFHENLHALFHGNAMIGGLDEASKDKFLKNRANIQKVYKEDMWAEEMFVKVAADAMAKGDFKYIEKYLPDEYKEEFYNTIKDFGYEREEESERRRIVRSGTGGQVEGQEVSPTDGLDKTEKESQERRKLSPRERKERLTDLFGKVADMGLDGVLGNRYYGKLLMDIYQEMPIDVRRYVSESAIKHYGGDFVPAMSDYLNVKATAEIWGKVAGFIRDALREAGFDLGLNEADVKYMLWRSQKPMKKYSALDVAEDIDARRKFGVDEGERFRTVSAAPFDPSDKRNEIVKKYDAFLKKGKFNFIEAFQDRMYSVKVFMDMIVDATGKKVRDFEDAYEAENQLGSINKPAEEKYLKNFYKPIVETLNALSSKYGRDAMERYIYCKSGLERNEVLRQRDADEAFNAAKEELDDKLAKGQLTQPQYDALLQQAEDQRQKTLSEDVDYSGIRGMLFNLKAQAINKEYEEGRIDKNTRNARLANLEANRKNVVKDWKTFAENEVAAIEGRASSAELKDLWKKINAATNETLRMDYESGMIDKATYDAEKNMMKYYVPLRNWADTTAEEMYEYRSELVRPVSSNQKRAKGRESQADNPIATIALMAQNAIVRGNRNKVKQKFYAFVANRETGLASVRDVWYVQDLTTGDWEAKYADTSSATDAAEFAQILDDFETDMQLLESQGLAYKGKLPLGMKFRASRQQKQSHVVPVMINGKEYAVYVNGNPRPAQAMNGETNSEAANASAWYDKIKRIYGAGLTSWNPDFIIPNMIRDGIHASTMTFLDAGPIAAARFALNGPRAFGQVFAMVSGLGKGFVNPQNQAYFEEFVANGGETGYTAIHTLEDYKKEYDKLMNEVKGLKGNFLKNGFQGAAKFLEAANRIFEDVNRFNAYVSARESGESIMRSISAAKNITVNFNRKGALSANNTAFGTIANAMSKWILFFNPAVQGIAQLATKTKVNPKRAAAMASAILASGFFMPMLNEMLVAANGGDDEDDYWNQSDFKRRNNWLLFTGDGYASIPLPPVLRELYGIGDIIYGSITGHIPAERAVMDMARQVQSAVGFVNLIPEVSHEPDMVTWAKGFAPDIAAPMLDVISNTNFMGRPIAKWTDFNEYEPEYARVYKGVSPQWVELSKLLNQVGGQEGRRSDVWGNFINPAMMEHLVTSYGGGIGKTINNLAGMALEENTENLDPYRKSPIVPRFYIPNDEKTVVPAINRKYYDYDYMYNVAKKALKNYQDGVRSKEHPEWKKYIDEMQKNGEMEFIRFFEQESKRLTKMQNLIKGNPTNKKELEEKIIDLKAEIATKCYEMLK